MNPKSRFLYAFICFSLFAACKANNHKKVVYASDGCDNFRLDIQTGELNGISPMASQEEIKEWFACYTSVTPDGASKDCGGGVFYDNHKMYYYTFADYLEIREGFKGKTTYNILGKNSQQVKSFLGDPVFSEKTEEDIEVCFYSMEYGCLRINFHQEEAKVVAVHFYECDMIELCY